MSKTPRPPPRKKKRDKKPGRWPDQFKLQVPAGTKTAMDAFADEVGKFNGSDVAREVIELVLKIGPRKYSQILEALRGLGEKRESVAA